LYKPAYEGLGRVMCYMDIVYSTDRKSANVTAKCRKHDSIVKMEYNWNNEGLQSSDTYAATGSLTDALSLVVKATDGDGKEFSITMEAVHLLW
jgi:hypothetical protein